MPEPDQTASACETARHPAHPLYECDEVDGFTEVLAELWAQAYAEACAEAEAEFDRRWITGSGTGEIRGLLAAEKVSVPYPVSDAEIADHGLIVRLSEPTPLERALEILAPKLKKIPGYIPTTNPKA